MDNRIIGSLLVYLSLLGTITYALFFEGLPGKYSLFLSWPSFLVVFGGGTGIILMRKHTYQDNQLGKHLKREFILAGWIGFMIGLVLLFSGLVMKHGCLHHFNKLFILVPLLLFQFVMDMLEVPWLKPFSLKDVHQYY